MKHREPDEVLKDILDAQDEEISLRKILVFILQEMGGPKKLANSWAQCFKQAREGGQTQARMLSDLMHGIEKCTTDGAELEIDDPAALKARLQQLLSEDDGQAKASG